MKERGGRWRPLLYIGLAIVLVVDIGLVVVALSQVRTPPDTGTAYIPPSPVPTFTVASTASPTDTATEEPVADEVVAVAPQRLLSALDDQIAWRASAGSCPTTALTVQTTTNGGGSWSSLRVRADAAASSVLKLDVIDEATVSMITQNSIDCGPQYTVTESSGLGWASYMDGRLSGTWFVVPSDPAVINSPAGPRAAPCVVVDWAARSDNEAAVLCREQVVFRTLDGGLTWDGGLAIIGAASIDDAPDGYVVAAQGQGSCSGVEVRALRATTTPTDGAFTGCFEARYALGQVVISAGGGSIWVWAGASIGVSTDGGSTWSRP